jgi:hypothetical protein
VAKKATSGQKVVAAGAALAAAPAGHAGLQRNAIADRVLCHLGSHGADPTRRLVAEDQRRAHHELADPPVFVVVDVGAADAYRGDLHDDLVRAGLGDRAFLNAQITGGMQDGGAV